MPTSFSLACYWQKKWQAKPPKALEKYDDDVLFGQNIKFLPAQQLHREIVANTNPRTFWHFTAVVVDLQDLHTKSVFRYTVEHTYIHTTSQKYMRMYVHMGMELAATETDLESNCHFIIG